MKILKQIIFYIMSFILLIILSLTILNIIIENIEPTKEMSFHKVFGYGITMSFILSIFCTYALIKYKPKINLNYKILPYIILSIYLVVLCIIAFTFQVIPSRDFGVLYNTAIGNYTSEYFNYYPNNLLLLYIFKLYAKISTSVEAFLILDILIIEFTAILAYLLAFKLTNSSKKATISLLIFTMFLPFLMYSTQFYTDTFSFPIALLIPLILIEKDQSLSTNIYKIILASFVASFGYLLKGSLIIFLIAICITIFFTYKKYKKVLLIIPILIFLITNSIFGIAVNSTNFLNKPLSETGIPFTHWIAMGQTGTGQYTNEDAIVAKKMIDNNVPLDEIKKMKLNLALSRIKERNFQETITFYGIKLDITWLDSTYYGLKKLADKPKDETYINYIKEHKLINNSLSIYLKLYQFTIYIFLFIGTINIIYTKKATVFELYTTLSIIGFFGFFILWETRSRYLLSLMPILIILSSTYYFKTKKGLS